MEASLQEAAQPVVVAISRGSAVDLCDKCQFVNSRSKTFYEVKSAKKLEPDYYCTKECYHRFLDVKAAAWKAAQEKSKKSAKVDRAAQKAAHVE